MTATPELLRLFQIIQGRVIEAGAALIADNLEVVKDELTHLESDVNDMRDELWSEMEEDE